MGVGGGGVERESRRDREEGLWGGRGRGKKQKRFGGGGGGGGGWAEKRKC